jgi:tetratricopeptide (TPR) repeat protein
MKRALSTSFTLAVALLILAGCSSSDDLSKSSTQEDFGVRMARMNLWREALFRFKRAVEIDPADALAHNNLAVAYEANGDFEAALREYREAMRLDRSNQYIQKNYSRFVEFTQRNRKRQQRTEVPRTAAAAGPSTAVPVSMPVETTAPEPAAPVSMPVETTAPEPAAPVAVPPTPQPTPPNALDGGS